MSQSPELAPRADAAVGARPGADGRRRQRRTAVERHERPADEHRIATALERVASLPTLSEPRNRALRALLGPESSEADLIRAIESDVGLTVAVLRNANRVERARGAAGRQTRPDGIASVPCAVSTLGREAVELVIGRIATVELFEGGRGCEADFECFRLHAVATQRAADRLARELDYRRRDELLVSSLLHDVGKLVLIHAYDGYPERVVGQARTPEERLRAEQREFGVDHAVYGGLLVRAWGLPDRLAGAIGRHHAPAGDRHAALVRLADLVAHYWHGHPTGHGQLLEAARAVGLAPSALRSLTYELTAATGDTPRPVEPSPLSHKQTEVLRGLALGQVYKQIGADLGLAPSTVRSHVHAVYQKLGVLDRSQAVLRATERGWL